MAHSRSRRSAGVLAALLLLALPLWGCGNGSGTTDPDPDPDPDPDAVTVSGSLEHDGWGVGHVQLHLRGPGGAQTQTTTGSDGTFQLEVDVAGSLELEITPPGYFELAPGEQAVRTLSLQSGGSTQVTVQLVPVATQSTIEIELENSRFLPGEVDAVPGTRIRWVNREAMEHTVTPQGHNAWTRAVLNQPGQTFVVVMNNPGEFPYFCEPHQAVGMTGVLVIEP